VITNLTSEKPTICYQILVAYQTSKGLLKGCSVEQLRLMHCLSTVAVECLDSDFTASSSINQNVDERVRAGA
jgi:hypothetical protein